MKIKTCIFICVVLLSLCMTGCAESSDKMNTDTRNADVTEFQGYYANSRVANDADNGVYFFAKMTKDDGYFLYYYKNGMDEAIPVCSNTTCSHNDNTCNAYYSSEACVGKNVWYQNGRVYRIESSARANKTYLVSQKKDGTDRVNEAVLWSGDYMLVQNFWNNCFVLDKGLLYYEIHASADEDILLMRSGKEHEQETLETLAYMDGDYVFDGCTMTSYGGKVYYFASYKNSKQSPSLIKYKIYCYDTNSGTMSMLHEEEGTYEITMSMKDNVFVMEGTGYSGIDFANSAFDKNGNLYVWARLTGELKKVDMNTWTAETIYRDDSWGRLRYDGANLVLDNFDSMGTYGCVRKLVLVNSDTLESKEIALSELAEENGMVYCYGGNESFILFAGNRAESEGARPIPNIVYYSTADGSFTDILDIESGYIYDMLND